MTRNTLDKSIPFKYPSTRYSGSKLRLLDWIWSHLKDLKFNTVLDVFGGTGSVSLMFKRYGKQVYYNDILEFNQIIGKAIIENSGTTVDDAEINKVLNSRGIYYPSYIQRDFQGIFFLNEENAWLDRAITNINNINSRYKKSILFAGLFQACLSKRPFNLFHRANLYIRTAKVERSFGNKTTWETPFPKLVKKFVHEYNSAVFSNGKKNKVIGGFDALSAPNGVHLVYLDPPYFSNDPNHSVNYLDFYHFLERIALYDRWETMIDNAQGRIKKLQDTPEIENFTQKCKIKNSIEKVIQNFHNNLIALSYQSNGIPSPNEIKAMFKNVGKKVKVYEIEHKYVLSKTTKRELLFLAI